MLLLRALRAHAAKEQDALRMCLCVVLCCVGAQLDGPQGWGGPLCTTEPVFSWHHQKPRSSVGSSACARGRQAPSTVYTAPWTRIGCPAELAALWERDCGAGYGVQREETASTRGGSAGGEGIRKAGGGECKGRECSGEGVQG